MRNQAGQLRHIDFDMVEQMPPPINSTLQWNCDILLGGFAKIGKKDPRLDCSVGYVDVEVESETKNASETASKVEKKTTEIVAEVEKKALAAEPAIHSNPANRNYGTKGGPGEESRISQLTKGYYHFVPVPADKHDGYIISSRNPVDRVVSAFLYVHPKNVAVTTNHRAQFLKRNRRGKNNKNNGFVAEYDKFFECFPDVTTLALNLVGDSECAKFGRYVLSGQGKSIRESEMLNHFGYGYKWYTSGLLAQKSRIFALRQEHLSTDWINFNLRLNGVLHELSGATKDFKDQLAVKKPDGGISKEERHGLCVALSEEIELYLGIINAADNLTEEEKEDSRREIREGCSF
ncbi:MAG: hypothetical protein SGARI_002073 [Bacillariaceae sp.]